MRTFKLLLPVITNLTFVFFYIPFSFYQMQLKGNFNSDIVLYIDGEIGLNLGVGFCSVIILKCLFNITLLWLIKNATKYLSYDLIGRYILCGLFASILIDGTAMIYFYNNYLQGLPIALYYILDIYKLF